MTNTIKINIPITVEQVEKLAKAVARTTASRDKSDENERITKATFIRVLIDYVDLDNVDLLNIYSEEELKTRIQASLQKQQEKKPRVDASELAGIYKKFANDDQRKWVAGDFINSLFEHGLIEAQSSEELWAKLLKNSD